MKREMNPIRISNRLLFWAAGILGAVVVLVVAFRISTTLRKPLDRTADQAIPERVQVGTDAYVCGDSWFQKNEFGLWELYVKGSETELGIKNGLLTREQIRYQEEVFVNRLKELVPSERYLGFLKQVVVWMNRQLDDYVPQEYQREIYGVAMQASDTFNFIGPAYQRILNYHAAHDIGHALQNMNLVACTAFGVKGERSAEQGELMVGRNFDFHMGDDFSRNKMIAFVDPDQGYRFASITWGGMIGVVSGMNETGLVVSLNAAKSGIPGKAKTPVSILARKMLQYASTIEEAYTIAGSYETFVAESFLVSSAADRRTVVIEKSPDGLALYDPGGTMLILTNHFQSEHFRNSELTLRNKAEGASVPRWNRTRELLEGTQKHDVASFVDILRDRNGMGGMPIGLGNEKAVNQFVAHHGVVFLPESRRMWVSTWPYQLGAFLCYDLNHVFKDTATLPRVNYLAEETIPADPFLDSQEYADFLSWRAKTGEIRNHVQEKEAEKLDPAALESYPGLNPHYYYSWYLAGEGFRIMGQRDRAVKMYEKALSLEIPRQVDREIVEEMIEKVTR